MLGKWLIIELHRSAIVRFHVAHCSQHLIGSVIHVDPQVPAVNAHEPLHSTGNILLWSQHRRWIIRLHRLELGRQDTAGPLA